MVPTIELPMISSDFEKLLALNDDFEIFYNSEVVPKVSNLEVIDLMSMRSKYQLYVKMLQEVKYLEDISDLDLCKRHLHIEALPSNSFNQTEKDTFMRLKLRSIEGMLKDIRSDLNNEG